MKKFFIIFFIFIFIFLSLFFGILFTNYGNSLIASYIEKKVNTEQDKVKFKVDKLSFTFKTLDFNASIDDSSYINVNGKFELFSKEVDLKYDIKINELENLKNLFNYEFKGSFFTNGTFVGDKNSSNVSGVSNFASGETKYNLNLVDFEINNILLDSKNLKIDELLLLLNQPIYSKGILNVDAKISNFNSEKLNGELKATIEEGILNNEVINKEFEHGLPSNVSYGTIINSTFIDNKAISNINFKSSLLDFNLDKFEFDLLNKDYFSEFNLFVKNLEKLETFIGKKLKGELQTQGILKSVDSHVNVEGNSNIMEGKTHYKFVIKDNSLKQLEFNILDAKIENFFKLVDEPVYAVGNFEASGKINNFKELNGNSFINLKNIKLINEVINAVYNKNINETIVLDSKIDTKYENSSAISKIITSSNIANLDINNLIFDFKTSDILGNYTFTSNDLLKLKDFTKILLRGDAKLDGNIKVVKNKLYIDGKSNLANGNFDFVLNDNIFDANLKESSMKKFLYLINQKENFDSKANLKLNYNLLTKKGDLIGDFEDGHFLENDFTKLVNQFAKVDLTKEIYKNSKLNTKIDDKLLTSNLLMQSTKSKIEVNNSKIDLENNTIFAKIDTEIKDDKFTIILQNDLYNPTISFDLKEILDKKADKLGEKLNKFLGKEKEDEEGKEIINNLKNLF
ncbi:hypothetical protein ACIB15232_1596 [Aliarcobacter cibarius]|uniref:hypothetical protein n=1 Tax=Aliarcobacter cibarius TaxID=255507 RepID=UPI001244C7C6|nr:hypothetical protein [Aliarcobacter cibarius]QEZ89689.1 hypothetical protein ACIB15232_1596 [Aliarcobacter cibarius]